MRISIGTLLWRRHNVFKVWATCIERLKRDFPYDLDVIVIGSEGNPSKNLVESYGFRYAEEENNIGLKANKRLRMMKESNPDYYVFCGSDDIISSTAFDYVITKAHQFDEVSTMTLYYYDAPTKRLVLSPGYRNHRVGEPLAPWRVLSKDLVNELNDPWEIRERGIDRGFYTLLKSIPHKVHNHRGNMILDIKTPSNLTKFSSIIKPGVQYLKRDELYNHFPKEETDQILAL